MAYNICEAEIIGRVGGDAEARPAGSRWVVSFSVGCSSSWTGQDGKPMQKTKWVRVSQWFQDKERAQRAADSIKKGSLVHVRGELDEPHVWTSREGQTSASLQVTALGYANILFRPKERTDGVPSINDEDELPF